MSKELPNPWLLWLSLTGNLLFGPILDKLFSTHRYSENARHSVSGISGYLAYVENNRRALKFAKFIDIITFDKNHCRNASEFYQRQLENEY